MRQGQAVKKNPIHCFHLELFISKVSDSLLCFIFKSAHLPYIMNTHMCYRGTKWRWKWKGLKNRPWWTRSHSVLMLSVHFMWIQGWEVLYSEHLEKTWKEKMEDWKQRPKCKGFFLSPNVRDLARIAYSVVTATKEIMDLHTANFSYSHSDNHRKTTFEFRPCFW